MISDVQMTPKKSFTKFNNVNELINSTYLNKCDTKAAYIPAINNNFTGKQIVGKQKYSSGRKKKVQAENL